MGWATLIFLSNKIQSDGIFERFSLGNVSSVDHYISLQIRDAGVILFLSFLKIWCGDIEIVLW